MEVAAYRESSVLGRKRAFGTCKAKTEASTRSELLAARNLLAKAVAALSSPSSAIPAPRVVKDSRRRGFLAAEPRSGEPPAKKIKASPPPPATKRRKVTRAERDLLAAGLAKLASELPDHIMELLKKQSRGISAGEMEIDIDSVQDEAILELQRLFDEFVRERSDRPSPQEEHQGCKMLAEDEDEDVDILGGVSPLAIAPAPLQLAEEEDEDEYVDICGDASPVVMAAEEEEEDVDIVGGVSPMAIPSAPLPLAEEEDVDICGDASPVFIPKNLGDDATISVSSSSGNRSDSDSDDSMDSRSSAERDADLIVRVNKESLAKQREDARWRAREKARQEVLETERTAMTSETVHWTVLKSLHIVDQYNRARPDSLLRRLGLFLKADDHGIEKKQHRHRQIFQQDLEEREILG